MKGTTVAVVICRKCGHGIFSVAYHDFHYCPCTSVFVDGGSFNYMRLGWTDALTSSPEVLTLTVPQSKEELWKDYNENYKDREFGTLSGDEVRKLRNKELKKAISLLASKSGGKKRKVDKQKGRE